MQGVLKQLIMGRKVEKSGRRSGLEDFLSALLQGGQKKTGCPFEGTSCSFIENFMLRDPSTILQDLPIVFSL